MSGSIERLRRSPDVRRALRRGARAHGRHVVVHLHARRDEGPPRVAVVASRKVGGAVQRNRAKRLLREAVRVTGLPAGHDVVLVARAATATSSLGPVVGDLAAALHAAGVEPVVEHMFDAR